MASKNKTARKSRKNNVPADAPVIEVGNGTVVQDPTAPVVDVTPAGNEAAPAPAAVEAPVVDADQASAAVEATPAPVEAAPEPEEPASEPEEEAPATQQAVEPLPYDLRQGDPCLVTVGFKPRRLDWHALVVSKHSVDGVVVVQLQETVPPGDAVPGTVPPGDDGIRQVSVRVVRPAPVALTTPEREILAELWFASETEGHDFGLLADLLGIPEADRVSRARVLEAKGLLTCDDHYGQFTFTDRGRALFVSFTDGPDLKEQCIMGKRTDQRGNLVEVPDPKPAKPGPAPASAAATKPAAAGGTATAAAPRKGRKPAARPVEDQSPPQEELEQTQEEAPLEKPTAPRRGKDAAGEARGKPAAGEARGKPAPAKGKGKAAGEAPAKPAPAKAAKPAPVEAADGKVFDIEDIKRRLAAGEELARGEKAALAGQQGFERDSDVPWNAKKVLIISTLQELGATSAGKAQSSSAVAEAAGVSGRDVRHYCYHARAGGWVDFCKVEGTPGYSFFLTAKGAKCDPAKEAAKELAAKGKAAKTE